MTEGIRLRVNKEKDVTDALVLDKTTCLLSLGDECQVKKNDIVWRGSRGEAPYLIKNGIKQICTIEGNTPMIHDSRVIQKQLANVMPAKVDGGIVFLLH